jgi:hypothetical protein
MNKIIGGLLVLSLLGRPAILRIDYVAYEFYKSNRIIIDYVRKNDEYILNERDGDVDRLFKDMSFNKTYIDRLSEEKNSLVRDIKNLMHTKARQKKAFSDEFICELKTFNDLYDRERGEVKNSINQIEDFDTNGIQQEILHKDINYDYILSEFEHVIKSQNKVIAFLEGVIYSGRRALSMA